MNFTNSESRCFGNMVRDLRFGVRQLKRSPGFALTVAPWRSASARTRPSSASSKGLLRHCPIRTRKDLW